MKSAFVLLAGVLLLSACASKPTLSVENLTQPRRNFYQGDKVAAFAANVGYDFSKVEIKIVKAPSHPVSDGSIHLRTGRIPPPVVDDPVGRSNWFQVPLVGLDVGDYTLELWVAGKLEDTVSFSVIPRG